MKIIADENIPFVKDCFQSVGHIQTISGRAITAEVVKDADAVLVRSITKVNEQLLVGSSVKFAATATIGIEHIDIDYLKKNNIGFASAPGSNANSVAEYIITALLLLAQRKNFELKDKSIGIVGLGNVGSKVEKKTRSLGLNVICNDPPLQRQTNDKKYRPIQEIYNCDIITMHTPLSYQGIDKTYHLADEKFFNSLKPACIFLNSSRGGVVDTQALKTAIRTGKVGSAVLDVWENEPNIDTELLQMVDIATPHIAGYSFDGKVAGMIMIYNAFCEHFNVEPTKTITDFLPKPQIEKIEIQIANSTTTAEQSALLDAASQLYNIEKDDKDLRAILKIPADKKPGFFDGLRKNYPVRREFHSTRIVLPKSQNSLVKRFAGIGFKIND